MVKSLWWRFLIAKTLCQRLVNTVKRPLRVFSGKD